MNREPPRVPRSTPSRVAVGPTVFALLLCVIAGYMAFDSLNFRLAARLAPLLFATVTLVLAAVVLVAEVADLRALRRGSRSGHDAGHEPEAEADDPGARLGSADQRVTRGELVAFAWFGTAIASFLLLGFLVGMPLFMILLLRFYGRESWLVTLGVSAGVMVGVYLMFVRVLGVRVYPGLLGDLVPFL